ncbi:hypothetical protein Lal_00017009 [Lupinus albus]|nr:hypothetical protein Lal_00017009 [Lupinus albus]
MVIIRDIANNFSDDKDIELCCDDDEDLEIGSSGAVNITYGTPSSFFVIIDSVAGQDIQNRSNNLNNDFDNELFIGMQFESKEATINAIKQFHIVVEFRPDRYCYAPGTIVRYTTSRHEDNCSLILDMYFGTCNIYDEDDEEEDEEVRQLVRGETRQPTQTQLRVQPPRRRKPPPCGTSSHRRY